METKGKFLNKNQWYSICSVHQKIDYNCKMCSCGSWNNICINKIEKCILYGNC